MTTPSEITSLLAQAWEKDPDQHFFELMFSVLQTNETLFSLGEITHDQFKDALEQYLEEPNDGESVEDDRAADAGDQEGDTPSET